MGFTPYTTIWFFSHPGWTVSQSYKYWYRVFNAHGWSDYSPSVTLISAALPSKMLPVTTSMNDKYLWVSWLAPNNNGASITAYQIKFIAKDGTTKVELADCNGMDSLIVL